jgi:hypothetical protein
MRGTLAYIIPIGKEEGEKPPSGAHPEHPIYFPITPGHPIMLPPPEEIVGGPPHPDQGLPGEKPKPPAAGAPPRPTHPISGVGEPSHPIEIPPDPPPGSVWPGPSPGHPWVPPTGTPPSGGAPGTPTHPIVPPQPGTPSHPIATPPQPPSGEHLPPSSAAVAVFLPGVGWKYVIVPVLPSTGPAPGIPTPKK